MHILLKNSPDKSHDAALYRLKPRLIPLHIKPQARDLIGKLESQVVIRKMEASEQSEFFAASGFVPKNNILHQPNTNFITSEQNSFPLQYLSVVKM